MVNKLKKIAMAGAVLVGSSVAAMAQTDPLETMAQGAATQIGTIIPTMAGVFAAGILVQVGFTVYKKIRGGVRGA